MKRRLAVPLIQHVSTPQWPLTKAWQKHVTSIAALAHLLLCWCGVGDVVVDQFVNPHWHNITA